MSLPNKIALVTGASRGIGQAIALQLGKQGATVVGTATSDEGAQKITASFEENKIKGKGYVLNVADQASVNDCMTALNEEFGAPTILINNAAITRDNLMLRMKEDEWNDIINTNLTSVYRMSKACLKGMIKQRWGRVITISSVVGTTGNPGQANYAAAKAGVIGFSKSLAQEIATRGVTVNVIAPGYIETDMTKALPEEHREALLSKIPTKSIGQPQDIAAAVAFLASENAGYITGQTLHVNGGMYMN